MTNVEDAHNDVPSNINELCRLCLSKDSGILPIFDEEENGNNSVPLSFRILACVSIEVSMSDELPKLICQNCLSQVNTWHEFKQVCDSSQITLKEWLSRLEQGQLAQDKSVTVKQEPPDDDDMIEIHHNVDSGVISEEMHHDLDSGENSEQQLVLNTESDQNNAHDDLGMGGESGLSHGLDRRDNLDLHEVANGEPDLHLELESRENTELHNNMGLRENTEIQAQTVAADSSEMQQENLIDREVDLGDNTHAQHEVITGASENTGIESIEHEVITGTSDNAGIEIHEHEVITGTSDNAGIEIHEHEVITGTSDNAGIEIHEHEDVTGTNDSTGIEIHQHEVITGTSDSAGIDVLQHMTDTNENTEIEINQPEVVAGTSNNVHIEILHRIETNDDRDVNVVDNSEIPHESNMHILEEILDDVEMHHDNDSRGNVDILEIKQEEIEVCELGEEEEEEEDDDFNVEVVDDPLSFTAADAIRIFPVRAIKSEPIDADMLEEVYAGESSKDRNDSFAEDAQNFSALNRTYCEIDKVIKTESGIVRKKPRKRRPLTLRKRKTPVQYEQKSIEHTVVTGSKQKYFCFPAANGKEHYFCIPCGRTFPFKSYYMRHEKTHRKTRHVCTLCDRYFSCKSNLDRHFRLHTGQKPLTCQNCLVHFPNKSEFMKHKYQCIAGVVPPKPEPLKTESLKPEFPKPELPNIPVAGDSTGGVSFPCYICRQTFDSMHRLQLHRRSHAEFRCRKCNKTFSGGISLSNHLRTHNFDGFKRYSCKICRKNFSNVTSLVSHKRFHTMRENAGKGRVRPVPSRALKVVSKQTTVVSPRPSNLIPRAPNVSLRPSSITSKQPRMAAKLPNVASRYPNMATRPTSVAASKQPNFGVPVLSNTGLKTSLRQGNLLSRPPSKVPPRSNLKPGSLVSKSQLKHLNIRHNIIPGRGYCCTVCKKWVKTRSVLKRHMTSHTKLKLFSCFICNISMGYASSLHKHMRISHDLEISYRDIHAMAKVPALEEQEELCRVEQTQTPEKSKKPDKEIEKTVIPEEEEELDVEDDDYDSMQPKFGYTCNTCFKTFSNKRLLENHMKIIHMGGRAYKCNTCSKLFAYKHLLVKHAKIHTGGEQVFSCTVCSRTFSSLKTLNNHKGVHTRFKYYTCPICSKSFNGMKNYEQHQRLHMTNIRFRCKLCGKTFFTRSELNEHKKMHIKLKIYTCGVCKNSYNSMSALNRHKRKKHDNEELEMDPYGGESEDDEMNEEERLYVCSVCDRTFPDSVALSKHKLIHVKRDFSRTNETRIDVSAPSVKADSTGQANVESQFECLLCNRNFPDQSSLSKHKGWHSRRPLDPTLRMPLKGKKIYVCGFCNRSFANSGSLSKHRKLNCPPKRNCTKNLVPTALIQGKSVLQAIKTPMKTLPSPMVNTEKPFSNPPRVERVPVSNPSRVERAPVLSTARVERPRHFPCPLCERVFTNKKALVRHKGWHTRILGKGASSSQSVNESQTERNVQNKIQDDDVIVDVEEDKEDQEQQQQQQLQQQQQQQQLQQQQQQQQEEEEVVVQLEQEQQTFEEQQQEQQLQLLHQKRQPLPEPPPPPPSMESQKLQDKLAKRRTCDVCFKVYSSSSTLSRHKRLHTRKLIANLKTVRKPPPPVVPPPAPVIEENEMISADGLHTCRYCRKGFKFRRHLIDHERVHTGERPFSCNQCSLSFSRRAILWRHQKTHLGVRPFSCSLCPKTFLFNFQLTRHISEKHVTKDIYACHMCDKTFRTMLALNKHELTQH